MHSQKMISYKQRGATLIVALVILAAMTIFGMSSMRNTATQQSILKNSQLYRNAQVIAYNESNTQIDFINEESSDDEIIQQVLNKDIDIDVDVTTIEDEYGGLKSTKTAYSQELQFRRKSDPTPGSMAGGYSLGKAAIRTVIVEIESSATLKSTDGKDEITSANSTQIQGIEYSLPPLGI